MASALENKNLALMAGMQIKVPTAGTDLSGSVSFEDVINIAEAFEEADIDEGGELKSSSSSP